MEFLEYVTTNKNTTTTNNKQHMHPNIILKNQKIIRSPDKKKVSTFTKKQEMQKIITQEKVNDV